VSVGGLCPTGFRPYEWAPPLEVIAARHGLPRQIIRFDQNVPPLPGVPQVPLGESFARLNDYPDGTYRRAARGAAALRRRRARADRPRGLARTG
jgi:hypothetical protein